ncbi:MAG: hypothetical protein PWP07_592 [Epulopiscium sp.]|jgi:hypothetical protein|uniref:Uncharacterized protein n=1 Tax=Defluviitalea raffinosedens TaxID=1450156 RepID=A0A7C8LTW1_9FIRM|nr:hypothetical protein [Defluviitalea raffinosedens]MBZ4667515.1 hypothetical protein [Defluviitaleaceae bacterium]MDK2787367.1 hypothetical protein [Candidatus Epulonipiscium sp.]KAE9635510.1 hypothetical protein GND95_05025 [Defluviitalea raffinosedens]MBM7684421.1 hypothetical protein [Defluviitalea raffinosedens]HHW68472.1 hypothetical protein [Candidatus Epulonipiscium sp.]
MNKKWKRIAFTLSVFICGLFFGTGKAMGVDPGTNQDPLVSKSYVDARVKEVTDLLGSILSNNSSSSNGSSMIFEVVNVSAGQTLVGGQSTEIILRGGKGLAITSEQGGLQDITDGVDISSGQNIPKYHLLIIPRDDGRGIYAEMDSVFMIRGEYKILP